jgi:hypothetical protein
VTTRGEEIEREVSEEMAEGGLPIWEGRTAMVGRSLLVHGFQLNEIRIMPLGQIYVNRLCLIFKSLAMYQFYFWFGWVSEFL